MRIHLTCTHPTRSLVLALNAARTLLSRSGHAVSISWPELIETAEGPRRLGFSSVGLLEADVVVHAWSPKEAVLPTELLAAQSAGKPVLCFQPGSRENECPIPVVSLEKLQDAIALAVAESVAS